MLGLMTTMSRDIGLARLGIVCVLGAAAACGHGFSAGVGAGRASFGIGNEGTARLAPVVSTRAWVPDPDRGGGLLSLDLQLLPLHNPLRDETVSVLYVLPEFQIGGSALCVRAGLGPSIHSWGGNTDYGIELVPSVGASVGFEPVRIRGHRLSIEAIYRTAASVGEDPITTTLLGAQVSLAVGGVRGNAARAH